MMIGLFFVKAPPRITNVILDGLLFPHVETTTNKTTPMLHLIIILILLLLLLVLLVLVVEMCEVCSCHTLGKCVVMNTCILYYIYSSNEMCSVVSVYRMHSSTVLLPWHDGFLLALKGNLQHLVDQISCLSSIVTHRSSIATLTIFTPRSSTIINLKSELEVRMWVNECVQMSA